MISPDEKSFALGLLFRGIAHEYANTLNAILMNAQVAAMSPEDAASSLATITSQARNSGNFVKALSRFLSADDFSPERTASVDGAIELARALTASIVRRSPTSMSVDLNSQDPVRVNPTALSVSIALLIHAACASAASSISISSHRRQSEAAVVFRSDDGLPSKNELAMRIARQFCTDHDGQLSETDGSLTLLIPS